MPTGDSGNNLRKAIAAYTCALEVRTRQTDPISWAMTRFNLGLAFRDRANIGCGCEDRRNAIASVRAAATVWTATDFPFDYHHKIAPAVDTLRNEWQQQGSGSEADFNAIPAAE
jgi:hypothetical protein